MQHLRAYALRADFEGTVEIHGEDGAQTVDRYQGGVLALGDGTDIDVKAALAEGDGAIVCYAHDTVLTSLLDEYPPLKSVTVPASPAKVQSPFARLPLDQLRWQASMNDIEGHASASKDKLVAALEAQAQAQLAGHQQIADTVTVASAQIELGQLSVDKLAAVLDANTDAYEHAGVVEVPAALEELRSRAASGNQAAKKALKERDITLQEA